MHDSRPTWHHPTAFFRFISYSRRDTAAADQIVDALHARGFNVTIDRRDLEFGTKWQAELADFIRLADTVVWLVSEASIKSKWVNWELDEVTRRAKRLVPVLIGDTPRDKLPRQIGEIHILPAIGLFEQGRDLDMLVRVLQTDHGWLKEASRLADRAQEWITGARKSALLLRGAGLSNAEQWRMRQPATAPAPSPDVLDLILASNQAAKHRQRLWVGGSFAVAVGASALAGIAYLQSLEAARQSNAAIAQSAALSSLTSDNDQARGLLLAQEAVQRTRSRPSETTIAAQRNAVHRFGPTPLLEAGRRGLPTADAGDAYALFREEAVTTIALSDNGRWLIVGAQDKGTRELWRIDLEHRHPATTFRVIDTGLLDDIGSISHANMLSRVSISNSGRYVAAAPGLGSLSGPGVYIFEALREIEWVILGG